MVRLSSSDASLLMDVLEQQELSPEELRQILDQADPTVREIGEALVNPNQEIHDPDIKEAVESIRRWAEETKEIEEKQHLSA
jgi:hypothetical protein